MLIKKIMRELFPFYFKKFIDSDQYWKQRYRFSGNSGRGSRGRNAQIKADFINNFASLHSVESVIDLGCGDGENALLFRFQEYSGFDISQEALKLAKKRCENKVGFSFYILDSSFEREIEELNSKNMLPKLALSLEVIFHLVEDNVFEVYLDRLCMSSTQWVIIMSSNFDSRAEGLATTPHVRHRNVDEAMKRRGLTKVREEMAPAESFFRQSFLIYEKQ